MDNYQAITVSPKMIISEVKPKKAYVIGAPKCGSEILRQYLKYHPQVFFAERTQVSYWDKFQSNGLEWYKEQLPKTKSWQIGVDYTTDYFIGKELHLSTILRY